MSGFSQSSVSSQNSRGTKRKWDPKEDVVLVAYMVDLHNVRTFNADTRFKADYLNELEKLEKTIAVLVAMSIGSLLLLKIRVIKKSVNSNIVVSFIMTNLLPSTQKTEPLGKMLKQPLILLKK
ncbi:hypothetical protein Gotur_007721 [Gossypium turneri]